MRFFTIFTVLTAGAMAFAGVVPEIVEKRSTKDVQNAFTDLGHKFDAIIPKFDNCWDSQCSDAIVVELASAIDGFTATIGGLPGGLGSIPLATTIKDIITVSLASFQDLASLTRHFRNSRSVSTRIRPSVATNALAWSISTPRLTCRSPLP